MPNAIRLYTRQIMGPLLWLCQGHPKAPAHGLEGAHPAVYRAHTDQQLLCFLVSDGWSRASVGIDHRSEMALTTYKTEVLGFDSIGRMVFSNRTTPAIIHFNGPAHEKASQIAYAKAHLLLPTAATA